MYQLRADNSGTIWINKPGIVAKVENGFLLTYHGNIQLAKPGWWRIKPKISIRINRVWRIKEQYSFWYSEKHAQHYHRINSESPTDLDGRPDPIRKNFAEINGRFIPYTCCTTRPEATEPFEGALETFPDYRKIATGTIDDIHTRGTW